jgi:hypothetical protein
MVAWVSRAKLKQGANPESKTKPEACCFAAGAAPGGNSITSKPEKTFLRLKEKQHDSQKIK